MCLPGYGGDLCATPCGGFGEEATYGPPGRALGSSCVSCSSKGVTIGFSFHWNLENDLFAPRILSRRYANSPVDCLSEFSQYKDSSFYLPVSSDMATTVTEGVKSFTECVAMCSASNQCQFVTYNYKELRCIVRAAEEASMVE